VFACFDDGVFTHIADGRIGSNAGTDMVRLNLESLQALKVPVLIADVVSRIPARFRAHLEKAARHGGLLPPKTLSAIADVLTQIDPSLAARLARFSEARARALRNLSSDEAVNLALQKETLGLALEIAGLPRDALLEWSPTAGKPRSFLDGLPGARVREDAMLAIDFSTVPGFAALRGATHVAARMFQSDDDPKVRLTVIMANRTELEEQTGADLIYFNEMYRSFVMVQGWS
jgi:hypothetical protein